MIPGKGDVGSWIQRWLRPGDCAIDVGAHRGMYTALMADCVGPTGRVVAYEPDPLMTDELMETVRERPHVTVRTVAVGAQPGQQTLHLDADRMARSSLYRPLVTDVVDEAHVSRVDVPVVTLDSEIASAALVKIDTEGHEYHVFNGARRLLEGGCQRWIMEVWPQAYEFAGVTVWDLLTLLREHGLIVRWADGGKVVADEDVTEFTRERRFRKHTNWVAHRGSVDRA